jgi:Family of unknown function (DUF6116)
MNPRALIAMFLGFANQLKFRNLFLIIISLFIVDIFVPDFIPLIDEIILGLLAIILANWKKDRQQKEEGNLIEGEIIEEEDNNK